MTPTIVHQPRVAWDAARAIIRATYAADFDAFADCVHDVLGPRLHDDLRATRGRVLTGLFGADGDQHVLNVEAGRWRVILEDLLRTRPDLTDAVRALTEQAPRP